MQYDVSFSINIVSFTIGKYFISTYKMINDIDVEYQYRNFESKFIADFYY